MYVVIVSSLQVSLLALVYILARPLLRKHAGVAAMWMICFLAFLIMMARVGGESSIGASLFTLPWPAPHAASPIAALDYADATPRWPAVLRGIWLTGAYAYLAVGLLGHVRFRIRVRRTARPASARVEGIARSVYADMQTSALTWRRAQREEVPTQKELERVKRRKPPRLFVTGAVSSPASIVVLPRRVLLDREDYADAQLEAIFRHEYAHAGGCCLVRLYACFGTALGWFNPFLWYMRREARRIEELANDEGATHGLSEPEKRAYARHLAELVPAKREAPGTANVNGGIVRDREAALLQKPKHPGIGFSAAWALCMIYLFFARGFLVQPTDYYKADERSLVAMLGADEAALAYPGCSADRMSDLLMPFDADYTLYGAIGANYQTRRDGTIRAVALNYDAAADPAAVESGVSALEGYLTARLGAPEETRSALQGSDEALAWRAETKAGASATVTLVKWHTGSYWTDATAGGMLIMLYWDAE